LRDPAVVRTSVAQTVACVRDAVERATEFGDVGRALPALYVLRGGRIAAFEGLSSTEQAAELAGEEIDGCAPGEAVALLVVPR
jgi:hypothetical protein